MTIRPHTLLSLLALAPVAAGQWSQDPGSNLALSDGDGAEVQAKLASAPDGTTYASFYDSDPEGSPTFGYDVRLQRLGPNGAALWAPGGVVIADRGYSSTQDYGLDAGPNGDAWLAFRDDRFAGDQITATRVAPDGTQVWGSNGVQVTSTTAFVATPRIAATSDGGCVVAWTEGSTVRLQRLDAAGAAQWGAGYSVPAPSGVSNSTAGLEASESGAVIFSWIHQNGGFFAPRRLKAQKLDSAGATQWGSEGVSVFDTGSLQIGNFPPLVANGAGGALLTWYGISPLQCYVQHVRADGSQSFGTPGTGVPVSINSKRIRVGPRLIHHQSTDEAVVFWVEENISQSMWGISGQKLDSAGTRLWGPSGIGYVPLSNQQLTHVRVVAHGDGAAAVWLGGPGFGQDEVRGLRVDGAGVLLHPVATLASTPSSKDDLEASAGPLGDTFAAWHGNELGNNDVFAQNLLAGGGLGPAAGGISHTAGTNVTSYTATVGPLGGTLDMSLDLTTTGHLLGVVGAFLQPGSVPFGSDVILVNPFGPEILHLSLGGGTTPSWSVPLPLNPALVGKVIYTQGVHFDPVLPIAFTNAIDVYFGL